MAKKLIPTIFMISFLLSQSIIHNPINNIQLGGALTVEASMIGVSPTEKIDFTVFFRSYGQETYFFSKMKYVDGKYKFTIPESFVNNNAIEYYIVSEINNSGIYAYPEIDPKDNPILAKSNQINALQDINIESSGLLRPNYQILSPENNSKLLFEDLMISLSYFKMEDIDPTYTKIYINNVDYTSKATMRFNHFVLIPNETLPDGAYEVRVNFRSIAGLEYQPIIWNFKIISEQILEKQKIILSQGGSFSGDYSQSINDDISLKVGELSANYKANLDWMKFKTNVQLSTLEDPEEQTKNRFSFNFNTSYFDIKLGDSYPAFSEYTIKGARLRGANVLFENNFLHFNILTGNLLRATEGLPDESMLLITNSTPYVQSGDNWWIESNDIEGHQSGEQINYSEVGMIYGSRDNYTFEQGIFGINLELTTSDKFKWGLEVLKVKDKVQSVNPEVDGVVLLPEEIVRHLYSDIYKCDYDEVTGECVKFICDGTLHDVVEGQIDALDGDNGYDGFDEKNDLTSFNTTLLESYESETIDLGVHEDACWDEDIQGTNISTNIYQDQWFIYVSYENLGAVIEDLSQNSNYSKDIIENSYYFGYEHETLSEGWSGIKPQDNIVIATDFSHTLDDGNLKINYGLGFTMLNQNTWDPTLTYENLDKLGATEESFTDCNEDKSICEGDEGWDDSMGNGLWDWDDLNGNGECDGHNDIIPSAECEPFTDSDNNHVWTDDEDGMFNGAEIPDTIDNLEKYEDIFQTGISQVPIIPIDIEDGIEFKDFLTLPSGALFFEVSHKYFGHRTSWGFRQIGPEYNTLGNPYIQTNIREQYFTDRTYLLDNKLNILFKWKRTEDGISLTEENGETNKYDLNLGFYPGANMPTYNIGIGIHNRDNGIEPLADEVPVLDVNENGIVDSVLCFSQDYEDIATDYPEVELTCSDLTSEDYYYEEILSTQLYQPEKTRTSQYSLSINSPFEYIFKHNISLNMFVSEKKDLIQEIVGKTVGQYIDQNNNDYYSPASKSQSYNLGLRTTYNRRLGSLLGLNYTYYSYGYEEHPKEGYYQEQRIYMTDVKLFYDTLTWIGELQPSVNISVGKGSSNNFRQITLKLGTKVEIVENLNFNININSKFKFIDVSSDETEFYNDYALYIQLKYKF